MKRFNIKMTALGLVALAMTACSSHPDVEGSWMGQPTKLAQTGTPDVSGILANSQVMTTMVFAPSESDSSKGSVTLMSDISVMDAIGPNDLILQTYELSVSATAAISGTYQFTDEDDMAIALDNNTLTVKVDPSAVTFNANMVTGGQDPQLDTIKPQLAQSYTVSIGTEMQAYYATFQRVDDIHVHDGMLTCEINDRDYTFRK